MEPDAGRVFRALGRYPGTDVSAPAVAALAGFELSRAVGALDLLVDASLLENPSQDRYELHDLLREYARELAGDDPDADDRMLAWYLHTAARARIRLVQSPPRRGAGGPERGRVVPAARRAP